ncbi:MAG: DUF2271 domain-containing protein, partial [Chloroflexi bacterium]|nr:DUF2271 domain-containing protein [Chloroflexota bacterium]
PYVAIWIEDSAGKAVRTISVWGKKQKYIRDLKTWWKIGVAQPTLVNAVSRASRAAGQYQLVWDGKDDKGAAVTPGTYTVRVETARENGPNTLLAGPIPCADKPATAAIPGNNEVDAVGLSYGPPAGP